MKKINLLLVIFVVSFLNQTLLAELTEELHSLAINFTNLAKQIKPGRPLPPPPPDKKPTKPVTPPPLIPPKKPDETQLDFKKTIRVDFGEGSKGSPVQIKVGLVDIGLVATSKGYDLVVYGPRLDEDTKPEDFIVKPEIKLPGETVAKKVDRLSFPVDKAKDITWINNKISEPGPLANFILVKGTDYQALKKQEKEAQIFKSAIVESINKSNKETKGKPSGLINQDTVSGWLTKVKVATGLCESVVKQNFSNILKDEIVILGMQVNKIISSLLPGVAKRPEFLQQLQQLNEEKSKLNKCLSAFETLQARPSLESVLYKFYETYLTGTPKISDWWVVTPRKMQEPDKPTDPTKELNLSTIGYALQENYFDAYKNPTISKIEELYKEGFTNEKRDLTNEEKLAYQGLTDDKKREKIMLIKTNYKDPETGALFTIKGLLAYFAEKASWQDRSPSLVRWNQHVQADNYGKFWGS